MAADAPDGLVPAAAARGRQALDRLDQAINAQRPLARRSIARARRRNTEATPAQVIRDLEWKYIRDFAGRGAVVGAVAAAPGFSTGSASAGEALSSLQLRTLFALSIAEIHGVPDDEDEGLRLIVGGIVLDGIGSAAIPRIAARTGTHWGRQAVARVSVATLHQINGVVGRNFFTKYGTKEGIVVLGQVAPLGFGAAIGGGANAALAALHVRAARRAFGPPPTSWPSPTCTPLTSEDSLG
ncbi:hypothetical protein ABZ725_50525 [Streptomyces sp. NPDC006872]|uniref:hypothetical protein n=1 Tax=Streptomyces sp. NPDC006872 TaxID=3155720 RepID=UPI0033FA41C9